MSWTRWTAVRKPWLGLALIPALTGGATGCDGGGLENAVEVDGSSTVFPVTEAVAEEFTAATGGEVRVIVGISGTGGGFQRFCAGETDVTNASRPIRQDELDLCVANRVDGIELPIGYDGIAVAVNPQNDFVDCITTAELKLIWEPESRVQNWSDVRPEWPAQPIQLFGPGTDSGTFDYFTEVIADAPGSSRADFTASEDDNILVQGVAGDRYALGYFGYVYYAANRDRLKLLAVDDGSGCIQPSPRTIADQSYFPLSRPLFIYVSQRALSRSAVRQFLEFYMEHAAELVADVGYIPLGPEQYQINLNRIRRAAGAE